MERCGFEVLRRKYFSLRDNPAGLASSLAPGLDPMARRVRRVAEGPRARLLKDAVYLGLVVAAGAVAEDLQRERQQAHCRLLTARKQVGGEEGDVLTAYDGRGNIATVSNRFDGQYNTIQISRLNSQGYAQWNNQHSDANYEKAYSIAMDRGGNLFIAGTRIVQNDKHFVIMKYTLARALRVAARYGIYIGIEPLQSITKTTAGLIKVATLVD